jgi:hypothetical protein
VTWTNTGTVEFTAGTAKVLKGGGPAPFVLANLGTVKASAGTVVVDVYLDNRAGSTLQVLGSTDVTFGGWGGPDSRSLGNAGLVALYAGATVRFTHDYDGLPGSTLVTRGTGQVSVPDGALFLRNATLSLGDGGQGGSTLWVSEGVTFREGTGCRLLLTFNYNYDGAGLDQCDLLKCSWFRLVGAGHRVEVLERNLPASGSGQKTFIDAATLTGAFEPGPLGTSLTASADYGSFNDYYLSYSL